MISFATGDLLDAKERYICHQCNCVSNGAAGLAASIFQRFPWADVYSARSSSRPAPGEGMGDIIVRGDGLERRFVVALLAQYFPGKPIYGKLDGHASRLSAFAKCLKRVAEIKDLGSVAFPHRIGCGLAGGQWSSYLAAIEDFASYAGVPVTIYQIG